MNRNTDALSKMLRSFFSSIFPPLLSIRADSLDAPPRWLLWSRTLKHKSAHWLTFELGVMKNTGCKICNPKNFTFFNQSQDSFTLFDESSWGCEKIGVVDFGPLRLLRNNHAIISRGLFIFYPPFTAVYIVKELILQSIYVLNKKNLQFVGLESVVYNWERFLI